MELFYTTPESIHGNVVRLDGKEAAHAARVLRHKVGEQILVVDGRGSEYRCVIGAVEPGRLTAEVISQTRCVREPLVEVTLGAAITKGTKLDIVAEMATELGAARIVPLVTERTIAQVTQTRLIRLRLLSVAALKSSTRTMLPEIKPPQDLAQFLKESAVCDLRLIAWEDEKKARLADVMTPAPRRIALLIGPEGGFPETEVELARDHGFRSFSMGPRRLRAETACIAALAMVLSKLGEI